MAYNATIRLTGIEKHTAMWIDNNNKKKKDLANFFIKSGKRRTFITI